MLIPEVKILPESAEDFTSKIPPKNRRKQKGKNTMTKQEQRAINDKAYSIFNSAMKEWRKDGESQRVKLYHCQAEVIWTIHYEILCSYNTIIACIEKSTGTLVDVLRTEYGYTNTSAQHIRKFSRQYFGDNYTPCTLVSRPV